MSLRFSDLTGRWLELDDERWAEALARPDGPLGRRLHGLGLLGAPDPQALYPCRHRRVLRLREALWVPTLPVQGGLAYREVALDPAGAAVWDAANGARTTVEVARAARVPLEVALRCLAAWTARDVQAAQLRERPTSPGDPGLLAHAGFALAPGTRDGRSLLEWHLAIRGDAHFDRVETTVAHALRDPHPALGGVPYGRRLRDRLGARGWPVDGPVVEVGCGDGALAAAWDADPWWRIDLSPALLAIQARTAPRTAGVLADAERLPLRDHSVRLLVSNEVLADLPATRTAAGWDGHGARRFVEQVARVLAPNGRAFLSEFGDPEGSPGEAVHLDHPEVGVDFGALVAVARGHGLAAELVRLDDLLGADLSAPQLARHSWLALRARWPALPARAWTPATLALPEPVEGIEWTSVAGEGPGPVITRFWALLLAR